MERVRYECHTCKHDIAGINKRESDTCKDCLFMSVLDKGNWEPKNVVVDVNNL